MQRNDTSNISPADVSANSGKWIAFVSKDYPDGVTLVTTIIAAANDKSELYLMGAVITAGDAIATKEANNTNTDRETLIIHYIEPPQPE